MRQEQEQQFRDIMIIYNDIKILAKVEMNKIVSTFFRCQLKKFNKQFEDKAKQSNLAFSGLPKEQKYEVTLNSMNIAANSVMNSGISFGNYDKKKTLRFYIHNLEGQNEEFDMLFNKNLTFTLIRGNIHEKQFSFNIDDMKYDEFQKKIRQIFQLDQHMQIKFKNIKDNSFININDKNTKPINIFKQLRISKVGIYPIYQAGG